jgi:asparagine synthase (glutamine-hydrolysing)
MSGFAGIIHLDKKPVDPTLVEKLARRTERHGGDAFSVHCDRNFGLGHSLLRTSKESANETQPFSLDGNVWITGDVRIDAREELIDELNKRGEKGHAAQPDIELVAHAYRAWGEECPHHLLGDFAFAAWDQRRQRLFCARDSFGIKPLYYARLGPLFVFSNDIASILDHPAFADELNESAIVDYLAFGYNLDEKTTCFAKVQRLPPSHVLTLRADSTPRFTRYTRLVFDQRIKYRQEEEYAEQFLDLFKQAVKDRLRTDTPAFELSGGMDSTSVAAIAAELNRDNPGFSGKAITTDSSKMDSLDEEANHARIVAERAGLDHDTVDAGLESDFYTFLDTAQPYAWPFAATTLRFARIVRQHGCVMLTGQGADPVLRGSGSTLLDAWRSLSPGRFLLRLAGNMIQSKTLRGHGLRPAFQREKPRISLPDLPGWLDQTALQRNGSIDRWKQLFYSPRRYPAGCQSELAYDELRMPFWSHLFESYYHDLLCGIDCRHPFLDIRLINYLFAIPPELKQNKRLLRQAMKDLLPDSVLSREKAVVLGDIVQIQLGARQDLTTPGLDFSASAGLVKEQTYREELRQYAAGEQSNRFTILNPLSLQLWTEK